MSSMHAICPVRDSGNLITNLALPNGATITNAFDTAGRWTGTYLKNSAGTILNYHAYVYNTGNQRTKQTRINGSYVDYGYDNIGQVVSGIGKETNGTARLNERYLYAYDAGGNLNYRTNNDLTQTFTVDNLNQLSTVARNSTMTVAGIAGSTATNVTIADNGNSPVAAILYNDKAFARTNVTILSGSNVFTAVGADSLARSDTNSVTLNLPTTVSYTYDDNGNLTGDGKRTFVYDDENQLTMVTVTNGTGSSTCSAFVYDGKNRRRVRLESNWVSAAWVKTTEVRYIYDGMLVIQTRDAYNLPKATYTRGTDLSGTLADAGGIGGLLARTDHGTLPATHAYYHADGNGNVTMLVNQQQAVVAKYWYDPFGNVYAKTGPLAEANVYQFSSKEFHAASGLSYYGYRFYDAIMQRWVNRDPIHEVGFLSLIGKKFGWHTVAEINHYAFINNAPINQSDPLGLINWGPVGGKCCNNSSRDEFWLDDGKWVVLPPGKCTGFWDDCDGVTCKGGFYYTIGGEAFSCVEDPLNRPPLSRCDNYNKRRWTPNLPGPGSRPPGPPYPSYPGKRRGAPDASPPPDYKWDPQ